LTSPVGEFSKSQRKICDKGDIATNKLLKQTHFSGDWLLNVAVKIVVWHISYRSSITVSLAPSGSSQQFSCVPHVIRKIHENPIFPIFNFLPGADTLQAWPRVATVQQTRQERTTVPSTSSKGREK